jgi:hypothetical protein
MAPTFSYTLNNTSSSTAQSMKPSYATSNPFISPSSLQPSNWYYYLIKNSGNIDELTYITLDPGYTWYMFLTAPGGKAGKTNGKTGGGGGSGQIINVQLSFGSDKKTQPIYQLYLNPFNDQDNTSKNVKIQTFTTNTSFTTTNSTPVAGTYNLYPGSCGGKGSPNTTGQGGYGGSVYNEYTDIDPGCIGSAGGGEMPGAGASYSGYKSNTYSSYGTAINVTFSDGLKGSVSGGITGSAGNTSQVMFYCVG